MSDMTDMPTSADVLQRYERFLSTLHADRTSNLNMLVRRERVLTAVYILMTVASITSIGAVLLSFALNDRALIVVLPFVTICLATLAISSKQLQVITGNRIKKIARDATAEEVLRGAIIAFMTSQGGTGSQPEVRRLIGALLTMKSDAVSNQGPSSDISSTSAGSSISERASDAWDPISVFLAS